MDQYYSRVCGYKLSFEPWNDKFEQRTYLKYCNGAETFYSYDPQRRRLQNLVVNAKAGTIMDNAYSYDAVSNVLGIQNNAPLPQSGKAGGRMSHSYTYDPLYRLASATGTYAGADNKSASYTLSMDYDNMHRITGKRQQLTQTGVQFEGTLNAGYDLTYTYQKGDGRKFQLDNVRDINYRTEEAPTDSTNINNGHKYEYDLNGNLVYINTSRVKKDGKEDEKVTEQKYRWDEENRLLAADENGFVSNYWYDADGERTVKTSGENEAIYVNSEFSGGNTGTARFSLYVSPYLVAGQGGKYTKHIYVGSQRIVSKLGDLASYGSDPRRIPYAGNEADVLTVDYKAKYNLQIQSIKDNYKTFDIPYNGEDNDDYVNGQGFCCNDGTPEAAQARVMARTRAASGNFKPNDEYEKMQFYYHPDHLGSSSYITNLDGEVSQHIEYVPFGEVFIEERNNTWNTPYLFNAKEFDEETGMYYYGARYYEPRLSLWMSTDPMEEHNLNLSSYVYCHNNPIILVDPNGMTDYFNLNGKLVRHVDDGKTDRIMLLINSKKDDNINAAIKQGTFINVPSDAVVNKMEEAYDLTEKNGKEYGFRVGNKGTISTMVSGKEKEIGSDEWKPAISSIVEQGDLVSYDVHTHPKPKYEQGDKEIPFNNMPSGTDKMNTVGNQPNVVLGYFYQETRNTNILGSGQTDVSFHRSICFYNKNGAINSEEIRFSDFKSAVKRINKEQ